MQLGEGICSKSGSQECRREAALLEALALPLSPEAVDAMRLFDVCGTQWRVGMSGGTGLDYTAVVTVAGTLGTDFAEALPYLQILEGDQLEAWFDERKAAEKKAAEKKAQVKKRA
jgi:Phage related hypothetical protein (DUF1799)